MHTSLTRRFGIGIASAAAAVALLAGCSSNTAPAAIASDPPDELSGTVSLWHFFNGNNAEVIEEAADAFEKVNPEVTVEVHDGQDDEKLQKAIAAGQSIDVGISYSTAIVGSFCSSGAFRDLDPFIERDGVDLDAIPAAVREYTQYEGQRCTLPMMADTTALLYSKSAFAEAGITEPPKTLDELKEYGLKLTTYNDDGSIKQLGFNPLIDFYENGAGHFAPMIDGPWLDEDGKSLIGGSEGWQKLIQWQKDYVDEIGYDKLKVFTSGLGQEFSADNAFQKGQVLMEVDGEWRAGYARDQAPDLDYGVAPSPVLEGYGSYGASSITGNVAGIGKGSQEPELAWALLKYLSTDTDAQVLMGNGLKNIPTLGSALESPDLEATPEYQVFIDAAKHPDTKTTPATRDGASYITTFQNWWADYQQNGGDLKQKLAGLDEDINNANALAGP